MHAANTSGTARGRRAALLAKKALNQWLDGDAGRVSRPLFVLGAQRSGTTMLCRVLERSSQVWVHPEKSTLAYADYRLRSPALVAAVTQLTPADVVVYKPLCDSHLGDRLLALHEGSRAIWAWRDPHAVARSAVAKWGDHQRTVVASIARGRARDMGWRGERIPPELAGQLAEVWHDDLSEHDGAALFWYLRNSFLFSLGLDTDPRVLPVSYAALVSDPVAAFRRVFDHAGLDFDARLVADVDTASATPAPLALDPTVQALVGALHTRLKAATPA